jgi:iron complex transport system ATP-binding protein
VLEAQALSIGVPGRRLVTELSLSLRPGDCSALLGRNGSGKSSLLAALCGLRPPEAGAVLLDGRPLADWPRRERARRVGVLLQDEDGDFWGTALDYVRLGGYPRGGGLAPAAAAQALLEAVDLAAHAGQRYRTLSGGERQRARLAQLLMQAPRVMLLDEPLQHLDLAHQAQVLELLGERVSAGCAAFMALHEPAVAARHCRNAVLLYDAGRVAQGPSNIMLTLEHLESLYQCRLEPAGTSGLFVPLSR